MKERPILFSAPMVRAILAGTKTQTRRALRVQPPPATFQVSTWHHPNPRPHFYAWEQPSGLESVQIAAGWCYPCPYGQTGDRLWVRETWGYDWYDDGQSKAWKRPVYRADIGAQPLDNGEPTPWKPSIHMPRCVSRITLAITGVRVERLRDINEEDAQAEGAERVDPVWPIPHSRETCRASHRAGFRQLWQSINGADSWDANPWVWVVEFEQA